MICFTAKRGVVKKRKPDSFAGFSTKDLIGCCEVDLPEDQ